MLLHQLVQAVLLASLSVSLAWANRHNNNNPFHLKHFWGAVECGGGAHHSHHVHLGKSNGGCEDLNLRGEQCIEILRKDCTYEFYSNGQCRGGVIAPNQGARVGSVKVKYCPDGGGDSHGFRLGWVGKKYRGPKKWNYKNSINFFETKEGGRPFHPHGRPRPHHHDKSEVSEVKEEPWYWDNK